MSEQASGNFNGADWPRFCPLAIAAACEFAAASLVLRGLVASDDPNLDAIAAEAVKELAQEQADGNTGGLTDVGLLFDRLARIHLGDDGCGGEAGG